MKLGGMPKDVSLDRASGSGSHKKRRPSSRYQRAVTVIESPDWLPKGWVTELRIRETGASAGTTDKYFFDPVSDHRFRSKKDVFKFVETGYIRGLSSKRKNEDPDGKTSAENKSSNTAGVHASKRPTKVRWVLNSSEGSWVPFIDEEDMNGSNLKEGELIFDLDSNANTYGSGGNKHSEHPNSTEEKASSSMVEFNRSNVNQHILSVSDCLPGTGTINRNGYKRKVKKFMRQDAKDLLEPLGRKLCKQALAFVKESRHSSMFFEKQAKAMPESFYLSQNFGIDC